jgi:CheY-like chemotaxis protein
MPRMDGFDLYEHIKKIDARIKVVFMTASKVNYEALSELLQVDRLETSYEDKEAILRGS